jgi:hypothetical protein
MIGARLGANMSGENAKNAANVNGADVNGESMSAGNGTVGVTGMTGDTDSADRRSHSQWPHCPFIALAGFNIFAPYHSRVEAEFVSTFVSQISSEDRLTGVKR